MSRLVLLAMVGVFSSAPSSAAESELKQLFPKEAELFVPRSGLTRLEIPAEILKNCKADLSDLRIFDVEGKEVAFLLDRNSLRTEAAAMTKAVEAKPVRASQEKLDQGKARPQMRRESYTLAAPDPLPAGQVWELVLNVRAPQFVRRIEVTDEKQSPLVRDESIFRLPAMNAERARISLPQLTTNLINVVISGEENFFLEPRFHFENRQGLGREHQIVIPLRELSRLRENGKTILELERPPGVVPQALLFQTSTNVFNRHVEVFDWGRASPKSRLGSGTLFRVAAAVNVEDLEIPLLPANGDRLRLEINDGDSPELSSLAVSATLTSPVLIFDLPSKGQDLPSGIVRFGGARARAPQYDLAGLLPATGTASGARAQAAANLYDSRLASATLGVIRENSEYQPKPVLAFAMRPGAEADVRLYSHRRQIKVGNAPEGLSRLTLSAPDLALIRRDFADIRIVDKQLRQWPYLLEPRATLEWTDLSIKSSEPKNGMSQFRLQLPASPFLLDSVEVEVSNPYFDRTFKLVGMDSQKSERVLTAGRMARGTDESNSGDLMIPVTETWITALELRVENGNDAPLELRRVRAREPQPDIYLVAPSGKYSMVLGNSEDGAPTYEIDRVRSLILSVSSAPATTGQLEANPQFQKSARLASSRNIERFALWAILGMSVVVLLAITLRIALREKTR